MAHKRTASVDSCAISRPTPTKRLRASIPASEQSSDKSAPRGCTQDRVSSRATAVKSQPSSSPPDSSARDAAEDVTIEEEYGEEHADMDPLLLRIYSGIHYSRSQQRKNLSIMQTVRISIPLPLATPAEGTALVLLRRAEEDGFATFILKSSFNIVFELGMPVPYIVPEGAGVRLVHSAQWWVGKSAAEVKAGPYGEEKDIRRAVGNLKGLATKKEKKVQKSKRQRDMEEKLSEGLRRQIAKEKRCDSDEDGEREWTDSESESEIEDDDVGLS